MDPQADATDQISHAVRFADRLAGLADDLVGHFVDVARTDGVSWTQIGAALGVSKQAAQQRFVTREKTLKQLASDGRRQGFLRRFTPPARQVVDTAATLAKETGHHQVGPEHLLLAVPADSESLATRALVALGASPEALREALLPRLGPADKGEAPRRARFSTDAKRVLHSAVKHALRFEHNYIGTEHLLLGLLDERQGPVAGVLRELGVTADAAAAEFTRVWSTI
jgi:hypothetical protein